MSYRRTFMSLFAAGAVLLAGCGSDDDDEGSESTSAESAGGATSGPATTAGSGATTGSTAAATGDSGPAPDDERDFAAESSAESCTEDKVGGSVSFSPTVHPTSMDPARGNTGRGGGSALFPLYDALMRYDPATLEWEPHVAESFEPNEDASVWTMTLREGVTFGNGDPLTAEAVKASVERHQDPTATNQVAKRGLGLLESIEVLDDLTLTFTLSQPWGGFAEVFGNAGGMITNPAVVAAKGEGFATDAVGAGVGPYELVRYVPGEEVVYTARDDYWGGVVCIEEIRVASIPNGDTLRDAMRNQERDIAVFQESIVSAEARAEFKGWDAWNQTGAGMTMNEGFGEGEHAAEDQRVKMAMAKAIDPEVMHQRGYGGFGFPANSIIHPDHPLHPGVEGIAFDPEGAAALVEEAKADGWDGVVRYDCIPVPEAEELSIAVQSLFENVGMTLKISLIPISELISKLVSGNVDLTCASPIAISEGSLGSAFLALRSGAPGNLSGYADPKMDVAIEQLLAAQSIDETKAALAEIQKVHNEHPVGAVYGTQKIRISYQDRVHGLLPTQLEEFLWHRAYVDQ